MCTSIYNRMLCRVRWATTRVLKTAAAHAVGRGLRARRGAGFSLIELLVVIAIIALLVSILVPSLREAKELAMRAACLVNQRHIVSSASIYATDYDGVYPIMIQPLVRIAVRNSHEGNALQHFGMGLLVREGMLPASPEAAVDSALFCPAYHSHGLNAGMTSPKIASTLLSGDDRWGYTHITYAGKFCTSSAWALNPDAPNAEAIRRRSLLYMDGPADQTAARVSPILSVDEWFDWGGPANSTAHGDGFCAALHDGSARWIDMDAIYWSDSTPAWHVSHSIIDRFSTHYPRYPFWEWARDEFGRR